MQGQTWQSSDAIGQTGAGYIFRASLLPITVMSKSSERFLGSERTTNHMILRVVYFMMVIFIQNLKYAEILYMIGII